MLNFTFSSTFKLNIFKYLQTMIRDAEHCPTIITEPLQMQMAGQHTWTVGGQNFREFAHLWVRGNTV